MVAISKCMRKESGRDKAERIKEEGIGKKKE